MQPKRPRDAGSGHRVRQFAQATDQAPSKSTSESSLMSARRDLIILADQSKVSQRLDSERDRA